MAVNESERCRELERIVGASPAIAFLWRAAEGWPVEYVSDGIRQLGYEPEALTSGAVPYAKLVHPDDLGRVSDEVRRYSEQGLAEFTQEYRILSATGEVRWIDDRTFIRRDGAGRITHYQGIVLDITERKRAEEALARSEAELSAALSVASMGCWQLDLDRMEFTFDDRYYRLHGVTAAEVGGHHMSAEEFARSWVHPDDAHHVRRSIERALASTDPSYQSHHEARILRKDRDPRWVNVWFQVERDATGRPIRLHGVNQDITERKRAEEALVHAQKLESLGVLAGGIAHDFNNLLTGILGNLSLAVADLPQLSPAREAIDSAQAAAQRAAELTRQILAYAGKGRYQTATVDLGELVEQNADLLRAAVSHRIGIEIERGRERQPVEVDPSQIRQVILNLVTNGGEAIGERGGTLTVKTGVRDCDARLLAASRIDRKPEPGRFAFLEVRDSGSGMDAEVVRRLFDPFFSTKFTGRGLGLPVVYGIIRAHGGAILLETSPGIGTAITVLIPAVPTPAAGREVAASSAGTILIVDDEPVVIEVCGRMLRRLGYDVVTAADGVAALQLFDRHRAAVRCVILDLTMPRMDGVEAFRELRRRDCSVPVLLASGYSEPIATEDLIGEGLAGFVQKPFQLTDLKRKLEAALGPR